jgi:hypothetical protein
MIQKSISKIRKIANHTRSERWRLTCESHARQDRCVGRSRPSAIETGSGTAADQPLAGKSVRLSIPCGTPEVGRWPSASGDSERCQVDVSEAGLQLARR